MDSPCRCSRNYWQRRSYGSVKAYIQTIPNVEKVEAASLIIYLGTNKYKVMNIPYSLEGVPAMDKKKTEMLQQTYFDHVYFTEEKSC